MHTRLLGFALASLAALAGCGSSGTGTLNVRLVDGPGDFLEINLHVLRVEIHGTSGGWRTLATPDTKVNLLTLRDGVSATLVDGATVPAGTYTQMRLVLGHDNTVMLPDETLHDLKVPSGQQSGVKLTVNFTVEPNTTKDVFIDLDGAHSIMLHEAGASEQYILRPVVRAVDRLATGAILGRLTDASSAAGLPGVVVTAQAVDGGGDASVVRSAVTRPDGSYVLDLLPVDGTYHVVSQPVVGTTAFVARASGGIPISPATPTPRWDAAFTATDRVGRLTGGVTPASDSDGDVVSARQGLDAGGTPRTLVVRTTVPSVASGVESYAMELLPAGDYRVDVVRRSVDGDGDETITRSAPVSVAVPAGGSAVANLAL